MRAATWIMPGAWMLLILWLGSDSGSVERTGRIILPVLRVLFPAASPVQIDAIHFAIRKLGHFTEYAVLTALWLRALLGARGMGRRGAAWMAWAIAAAWAAIDEGYQSTVASRTSSPLDVALDAVGALVVALPAALGWRRPVECLTRSALWLAALGGAALIAVNLATDVGSGLLWLTVPVAIVALLLRRLAKR